MFYELCTFLCPRSNYVGLPTNPFTILEPQDQEIGQIYVAQERRATDFGAQKL